MTKEEIIEIIKEVITPIIAEAKDDIKLQILLALPEYMEKQAVEKNAAARGRDELYKQHPEWAKDAPSIQKILEEVEANNSGLTPVEVVRKAQPIIAERIKTLSSMSMLSESKPERPQLIGDIGEL